MLEALTVPGELVQIGKVHGVAIATLKSVKLQSAGRDAHVIGPPVNSLLWKERRAHEAQGSSPEDPPQIDNCVRVGAGEPLFLPLLLLVSCLLCKQPFTCAPVRTPINELHWCAKLATGELFLWHVSTWHK